MDSSIQIGLGLLLAIALGVIVGWALGRSSSNRRQNRDQNEREIAGLRSQLSDWQTSLNQWKAAYTDLEERFARVQQQPAGSQASADFESQIIALNADLQLAFPAAAAIRPRPDGQSAGVRGLEELITNVSAAVATLKQKDEELARVSARQPVLEVGLEQSEATLAELRASVLSLQAGKSEAEARAQAFAAELSEMEAGATDLHAELRRALPSMDAMASAGTGTGAGRLGPLPQSVLAAVEMIRQRNADLVAANATIARLEEQARTLTSANMTWASAFADLDNQIRVLDGDLQSLLPAEERPATGGEQEDANFSPDLGARRLRSLNALSSTVFAAGAILSQREEEIAAAGARVRALETQIEGVRLDLAQQSAVLRATPAIGDVVGMLRELPPEKRAAVDAAIQRGLLPRRKPDPQRLTDIQGIGPVLEQRLFDVGLGTFWEVANLPNENFQRLLNLTEWQIARLQPEAVRADAERLAKEQDGIGDIWFPRLEDDFGALPDLSKVQERRLYLAGVRTYEALANLTVEQAAQICQMPDWASIDAPAWLDEARRLVAGRAAHSKPDIIDSPP